MFKDYIQSDSTVSETAFVEEHWTQKWDQLKDRLGDVSVARRDEKFRLMKPWLKKLPTHARILDGGCGQGHWTLLLSSLGYQATGVDISRNTIDVLKRRFPDGDFAAGDIRALPFPDAAYDAYFSWGTFEHFEDGLGPCITEAHRVLKPDGLLIITVPYHNLRHLLRDLFGRPRNDTPDRQWRFYQWRLTKNELRNELTMRGFRLLTIIAASKTEGIKRMVELDLGLRPGSVQARIAVKLLRLILPKRLAAHMLFAVAQRI